MPISADQAHPDLAGRSGPGEEGFSLLEVLVALALTASALSISVVAVGPMIERREKAADIRLVQTLVRDARYTALVERRTISLAKHAPGFLSLAGMETYVVDADIDVFPNGRCESGPIRVDTVKRVHDLRVEAETCSIIPQS